MKYQHIDSPFNARDSVKAFMQHAFHLKVKCLRWTCHPAGGPWTLKVVKLSFSMNFRTEPGLEVWIIVRHSRWVTQPGNWKRSLNLHSWFIAIISASQNFQNTDAQRSELSTQRSALIIAECRAFQNLCPWMSSRHPMVHGQFTVPSVGSGYFLQENS